MSTALVYVRQSRHTAHERTVSPETQRQACQQLAAVKTCSKVEVFEDLDLSGGKMAGRRGLQALIARLETAKKGDGDVAVVATYDQSRAFRNTADALTFYAYMEDRPWINVVFVQGNFDRSATGEFSYSVLAAAHAMERRMTGQKIRDSYAYRNSIGAVTGMAPYGYRRTTDKQDLVVEADEAAVVRRVFDEYAAGQRSTSAIAGGLNADGILKPGSRSGGLGWMPDTIVDLLQNVAYTGRTYSVSRARREGDVIAASWRPIVDRELFESAQQALRRNRRTGRSGARPTDFVFSRLLVCNHCLRTMRAKTVRGRIYYFCRQDVASGRKCEAGRRFIREDRFFPWAETLLDRLDAMRPDGFDQAKALVKPFQQSRAAAAQVDASLERIRKLFTWGHIDEAEYQREHKRLSELRAELESTSRPRSSIKLAGIRDAWRRGQGADRRQLLTTLFDGLVVKDQLIIECIPRRDRAAEVIAIMDSATGDQWREGRDSNPGSGNTRSSA